MKPILEVLVTTQMPFNNKYSNGKISRTINFDEIVNETYLPAYYQQLGFYSNLQLGCTLEQRFGNLAAEVLL